MVVVKVKPPYEKKASKTKIVNEVDKPIDKYFPKKKVRFFKEKIRLPNTKGCLLTLTLAALLVVLIYLIFRIL